MARYQKIFAGPSRKNDPQVAEALASVAIIPGRLVVLNGSGQFALAGASTVGKVFIADVNSLGMKKVDEVWAANDTCVAFELEDSCLYRARLATGQNISKGDALTPGANGELVAASTADYVVGFAHEDFNNTSGSGDLITIRPANGYVTEA